MKIKLSKSEIQMLAEFWAMRKDMEQDVADSNAQGWKADMPEALCMTDRVLPFVRGEKDTINNYLEAVAIQAALEHMLTVEEDIIADDGGWLRDPGDGEFFPGIEYLCAMKNLYTRVSLYICVPVFGGE